MLLEANENSFQMLREHGLHGREPGATAPVAPATAAAAATTFRHTAGATAAATPSPRPHRRTEASACNQARRECVVGPRSLAVKEVDRAVDRVVTDELIDWAKGDESAGRWSGELVAMSLMVPYTVTSTYAPAPALERTSDGLRACRA